MARQILYPLIDRGDVFLLLAGLMSCAAFLPLIWLLQNGRVGLEWTFVKRGTNYLIEAARD